MSQERFASPEADDSIEGERLVIGGVVVYAFYRADVFNPFASDNVKELPDQLNIVYLMHGRLRNFRDSTTLAGRLFEAYAESGSREDTDTTRRPLLVLAWDQPNHGDRTMEEERNLSWTEDNATHAHDMLATIDAAVLGLKNIADFLPAHIPHYKRIRRVTRTVSGVSMGGHAAIRAAVRFPGYFTACVPIIGSFDLTTLLLKRLHPGFAETALYIHPYGIHEHRLGKQARFFPEPLFDLTSVEDSRIQRYYDTRRLKTLAMFGAEDSEVPYEYSEPFVDAVGEFVTNPAHIDKEKRFQALLYPCGHIVTDPMVVHFAEFLLTL